MPLMHGAETGVNHGEIQTMMNSILRRAAILGIAAILASYGSAPALSQEKSLYERLGGYDAIAASVDDFFGRLAGDKLNGKFLATLSNERKKIARQLTVDYICEKSGGPCFYLGRNMKESHQGMGISKADWDASIVQLDATLDKFKVEGQTRTDFVAMVSGLEGDIVDKN